MSVLAVYVRIVHCEHTHTPASHENVIYLKEHGSTDFLSVLELSGFFKMFSKPFCLVFK